MFLGLEPKTVLSQFYPTSGLYPGRDMEGMYVLLGIPVMGSIMKLPPKSLIEDCVREFEVLRSRIVSHYPIGDICRKAWTHWFDQHSPLNEDVNSYVLQHEYKCPLASYFRGTIYNPDWKPSPPINSLSIFPAHVVIAMPSVQCRYDPYNSFPPYLEIPSVSSPDGDEIDENNPHFRYLFRSSINI